MKTVGKQLEEARLAKNWTPELASRETKIKVDRLRDLEADDYSHFASPTYARGFVRTYARALGLDEYRILRQLDNKLPDDDSANMVTETGVAYLPETTMPPRAAHRDYTGLYIVMALGAVVTLAIVVVLFKVYQVGELSNWFASSPETVAASTNAAPANPAAGTTARALPVDSNTPPPIVDATTNTAAATNAPTAPTVTADTNPSAAGDTNAPGLVNPRALPVDPSELTHAAPATPNSPQDVAKTPPRALPVSPSELAALAAASNAPATPAPVASAPVMEPSLPPINPSKIPAPAAPTASETATNAAPPSAAAADSNKRLVLTASQDSFVRVTNPDAPDTDKPLYADVLRSGQSIGFDGHKFSINVGIPSAVGIKLDGVNYGPHSDRHAPETFTVESHLP